MEAAMKKRPSEVIALLTNGKSITVSQMTQEKLADIEARLQETRIRLEVGRKQYQEYDAAIEELMQKREDLSLSIFDMEQDIRLLEEEKEYFNA